MSTIDRSALQQGAWVSLVFAVPFSIGSRWVADHDPGSPWASVLWLAALGGFTLGAGIAAWVQRTGRILYTSPSPRDRTRSRMPSSA